MKILHTSDWHLGRSLYDHKRYDEFSDFLHWLTNTLVERKIDVLLVAGDVFDTTTPGAGAQQLYYEFLARVSASPCRHVVVIGGNHDSALLLDAPATLLKNMRVQVIGAAKENPADEVLVLNDAEGQAELIVCAVPYLRDRDIRRSVAGETAEDKESRVRLGIQEHYRLVGEEAQARQEQILADSGVKIPIVGMGHLFTAGGKVQDKDGVRDELYVGTLGHISREAFPEVMDFVALGHLHVPQKVGGTEHIRYCGSPLPMSFGEAKQQKLVLEVEFKPDDSGVESMQVREIAIPCFQRLEQVKGDRLAIESRIGELKEAGEKVWLELEYTGKDLDATLQQDIQEWIADSEIEVLRLINRLALAKRIHRADDIKQLKDLNEQEVFERVLQQQEFSDEQQELLRSLYQESLQVYRERKQEAAQ